MEILRVQPYSDILVDFAIPLNVEEETDITVTITDMADLSVTNTYTYQGEAGDNIQYPLSSKYDADYRVVITADLEGPEIIFDDNFHVVRPYVDPNTLGSTATEIAAATSNEELARAIIDSVIPQGFYFKKETFEMVGLGADYLPLWVDAKKILKVYENNILVFDVDEELNRTVYEITKDKTAIIEQYSDIINRTESAPNLLPTSASDLLDLQFGYRGFPRNFDYRVILEVGHTAVPSDIVRATKLLIEDISCGKLEYPKRYVSAYNTDQYKVQFDKRVFEGTGNLIVDKILSKYAKSITRLGVL
jgi:hypothetical protein